jgi:hypothetical protein
MVSKIEDLFKGKTLNKPFFDYAKITCLTY